MSVTVTTHDGTEHHHTEATSVERQPSGVLTLLASADTAKVVAEYHPVAWQRYEVADDTGFDAVDPELLDELRRLGGRWGPLGVALVAAQLSDPDAVRSRLDPDVRDLLREHAPTPAAQPEHTVPVTGPGARVYLPGPNRVYRVVSLGTAGDRAELHLVDDGSDLDPPDPEQVAQQVSDAVVAHGHPLVADGHPVGHTEVESAARDYFGRKYAPPGAAHPDAPEAAAAAGARVAFRAGWHAALARPTEAAAAPHPSDDDPHPEHLFGAAGRGRDGETLAQQVARLAEFIVEQVPGEPSRSEGAVDTALRLLRHAYSDERAREVHALRDERDDARQRLVEAERTLYELTAAGLDPQQLIVAAKAGTLDLVSRPHEVGEAEARIVNHVGSHPRRELYVAGSGLVVCEGATLRVAYDGVRGGEGEGIVGSEVYDGGLGRPLTRADRTAARPALIDDPRRPRLDSWPDDAVTLRYAELRCLVALHLRALDGSVLNPQGYAQAVCDGEVPLRVSEVLDR